jgi:polyisoprenoid-binding protein YceI
MLFSTRELIFVVAMAALVRQAAAAELRSARLELDSSKTLIEFRLPGALHTTHGTFKLEHGIIEADPGTGEAGGSIVVDATSGESGVRARDNRMRDSVLEAQKYPEITFTPQHVAGQTGTDGRFQAKLQGVMTLHGAGHQIVVEVRGRLIGDSLVATSHFSVPYVGWGLEDPSILLFTVAKQVDIDIVTAGLIVWTQEPARGSKK